MFLKRLGFILSLFSLNCQAQDANDWQEVFRQWLETENVETSATGILFDNLSEKAEHPINLNQATREDLEQLSILTAQQVEQLLEYLNRYGPIRSLG